MSSTSTSAPPIKQCAVCGKDATKHCSRCKTTYYCCVDHQRGHWKSHRGACNDAFKADQYTLHKQGFDQIVKKYGLDTEDRSSEIADFLTKSGNASVSPEEFAGKFGMAVQEAVVFLEWIKVGVKFKEETLDAAKKSGSAPGDDVG
eukprot:CAMPEP_0183295148 /NCGR_PEP_ID=MMETSP0160_2-20130417/3216_1 /TAXON_ID=2839 ORGANISM="Odontella Sinensis, Strain Grunow 1884" /NCGR_SAMPLE_ID=MMETSP0160_2 /ASSEMBLY_ACC=CAM_ASM_000250 /LENGTH=145 /DNA_ID=CAMNT_0025456581 /DNA_START=125 /DNA_END=560 /DNA_ORIENTATION=-